MSRFSPLVMQSNLSMNLSSHICRLRVFVKFPFNMHTSMESAVCPCCEKWHPTVLVAGNSGVGKTSLRKILYGEHFDSHREKTFGYNAVHLEFKFRGKLFHLCVFDTAGIEQNPALTYSALEDTDCLILAYAVDNKESFDAIINEHLPDLMKRKDAENIKYVPILGTKGDLRREPSSDWKLDADPTELKAKYKAKFSINECSSRTGENVNEFFWSLAKELEKHVPTKYEKSFTQKSSTTTSSTALSSTTMPATKTSCFLQ